MIDFRYHVVSIVAVFLALATGLVLGASLLNAPLIEQVTSANDGLIDDKEELRDELVEIQSRVDALQASLGALAPFALRDQLPGQSVVIVELPGVDTDITTGLSDAVRQAGGQVDGVVTLTEQWTEQSDIDVLDGLVVRLTQDGIDFPDGGDAYDRAATLLAHALVADEPGNAGAQGPGQQDPQPEETEPADPRAADPIDADAVTTILQGLSEGGFVELTASPADRADLAIIVGPAAPEEADDRLATVNEAWVSLTTALDDVGRAAVLVGPASAAADGGVVQALRGDDAAAAIVSTVDSIDEGAGLVAAVLALSAQLSGQNGHYGQVDAEGGPVPAVVPTTEG